MSVSGSTFILPSVLPLLFQNQEHHRSGVDVSIQMSADDATKDSTFGAQLPSSLAHITTTSSGIDLPPLRFPNHQQVNQSSNTQTMALRGLALPSTQYLMSEDQRPRSQAEWIGLPSIRHAVPEIETRGSGSDLHYRTTSAGQSPTYGPLVPAFNAKHASLFSHKRRRLSNDSGCEADSRDLVVQRHSRSPSRSRSGMYSSAVSPTSLTRRTSIHCSNESKSGSNQTSPYMQARGLPTIRSPPLDLSSITRDYKPTLPSQPVLPPNHSAAPVFRGSNTFSGYSSDSSHTRKHTYPSLSNADEPPTSYIPPGFPNDYHPRGQSYSEPSGRERSPFSINIHRYSNSGNFLHGTELGAESKQGKRWGNLPKEATDKLRVWFYAHTQYPYPTEDEKDELMRQTGLQMNQICNWFINARRRQLPLIINKSLTISDSISTGGVEASATIDDNVDHGNQTENRSNGALGDSDDGASSYEDEFADSQAQRGPKFTKGGSY